MNEGELTQRIDAAMGRRRPSNRRGLLGIGDDAALWRPKSGHETVLTCDWFLEGTHFLRDRHPADTIGWKCLARAVSDVAAMGATPVCFLLSLALPEELTVRWLEKFLVGLRSAAKKFACPLVGGDTTRRDQVLLNLTVVGQVPIGRAVLRSGARPGDVLFVSGRLGEAELGLRSLRQTRGLVDSRNPLLRKHLHPQPRLALGRWLAQKQLPSAMMDLSDGLSTDLPRLCAASSVGARIEAERIPTTCVPGFHGKKRFEPLELALHGGDDYELLFAVRPSKTMQIPRSHKGVLLTPIGEVTKRRAISLIGEDGRETALANRGWDPFRKAR
jgi:thiamine-monophosphate kinase